MRWVCKTPMAISSYCCCFWDSCWREIFQSLCGRWRSCLWVRYPKAQAGRYWASHPTLTFDICWGQENKGILLIQTRQGTVGMLWGRPRAPQWRTQDHAWQCQGLWGPDHPTRLWGYDGPLYSPFALPSLVCTPPHSDRHCFWVRGV